ncbi:hypothetical protein MUK42_34391 [Musa troglodytarum]|uniref:Uncharacterized protein n=1 Tax=Musa troglodytarum TaxID=320322 RepID=A0A9E7E9V3_9LILI|nr:hypothetical protein MUK42_34391 [Musa troglodytarum]
MSIASPAIPSGSCQSKWYNKFASASSVVAMAKATPGQPLRPAPNGINWKSCPLKSMLLPTNLSGQNSSGFSHETGSLPIAQALITTLVPLGMR